ncbi:copper homeostasis protein [Robiginitalea myxolifaciens]|uniref:PF03932 family protein CutC n=1 Tax=Robiginitalea myxolifaciens TaxID=400055 RepID=A0A1I6FTS7_9FLAO|nr:copper homeostasis protein CutC [Robiginitalea myxolifaciens]SFR33355.1 copper homeostasis protein [Robiginitalea myxolifaciens]
MLVEVCANSVSSAKIAQAAGADRIEFCSELAVGGITPSLGMLTQVLEEVRIPVHVLIRPRSGDFCYDASEFKAMLRDIALAREAGVAGIVSGVLFQDGSLDMERTQILKEAAGDSTFTFHRAFDRCPEPEKVLEQLETLGPMYILSSGQASNATAGLSTLVGLAAQARNCKFMPGAGIGPDNAGLFADAGFTAIHLSGVQVPQEQELFHGPAMNSPGMLRETSPLLSDATRISETVHRIKAI